MGASTPRETVRQFLDDDGWQPEEDTAGAAYRFSYAHVEGGPPHVAYAQVYDDLEQFVVYVVLAGASPADVRAQVVEYLSRANYGLRLGAFEMDHDDGRVRFRNGVDFEGQALTPELVRNVLYPALRTAQRYAPGLHEVVRGLSTPADAARAADL